MRDNGPETLVNMTMRVGESVYRSIRKYLVDEDRSFNDWATQVLLEKLREDQRFIDYLEREQEARKAA